MSDQPPVSPLAPSVSPLLEADPNSVNELISSRIDEIFNKNPRAKDADGNYVLSDDDIRSMVVYYRKERQRYLLESQQKEAKPKANAKKKAAPTSVADALATSAADAL